MPDFIELNNVSFAYRDPQGKTFPVLRNISLQIKQGELVAVAGANGSGKTTFIRHLNGLLLPDQGLVRIGEQDTRSPAGRRAIHQLVGMVFQHPEDQIISSTLEDEVAFGPENLGRPSAEIRQQVEESLRAVGLWEMRLRPPHLLSAGQTQRLALAGVLAMRPRCIIFDEATTMLDPAGRRMALDWMLRLHEQGITILFVTHHMEEAALAQRMLVFSAGRIALDGPPLQVFGDPARLPACWRNACARPCPACPNLSYPPPSWRTPSAGSPRPSREGARPQPDASNPPQPQAMNTAPLRP